jgi:uncharacterized protein HemY
MMHSQLGECDLEEHQWDSAASHYEKAFALAPGAKDRFFAAAGRLRALSETDREATDAFGRSVLAAARENGVPEMPRGTPDAARRPGRRAPATDDAHRLREGIGGPP